MISFWISVVPPKTDWTRLSDQAWPTRYARLQSYPPCGCTNRSVTRLRGSVSYHLITGSPGPGSAI
jgi:hypothetical protein